MTSKIKIRVIQRTSKKPKRELSNTTFFFRYGRFLLAESSITRTGRTNFKSYL